MEEDFLIDSLINSMKSNPVINTMVLSLSTLFGGGAVSLFTSNIWESLGCGFLAIVCAGFYEYLSNLPNV